MAAALVIQSGTVSHQAAAVAHGLPILGPISSIPCLTLPPGFRVTELGTHLHRVALPQDQVQGRGAHRFTNVPRTCLDLAREFGLAAGLVAADHAVRVGLTNPSALACVYRTMRGRGGSPAAREVLDLVEGRRESPLETVSALTMRGLSEQPRPQVWLYDSANQFLARPDFYWDRLGVVGEADGRAKYVGDELWREKLREDRLREHGLVVVRWTFAEALNPQRLLAKLRQGFAQAERLRARGVSITARPST